MMLRSSPFCVPEAGSERCAGSSWSRWSSPGSYLRADFGLWLLCSSSVPGGHGHVCAQRCCPSGCATTFMLVAARGYASVHNLLFSVFKESFLRSSCCEMCVGPLANGARCTKPWACPGTCATGAPSRGTSCKPARSTARVGLGSERCLVTPVTIGGSHEVCVQSDHRGEDHHCERHKVTLCGLERSAFSSQT